MYNNVSYEERNFSGLNKSYDIVCFSHLRWDFVFQRPQHLLTRAAKNHKILFVEEPVFQRGMHTSYLQKIDLGNITVLKPIFPLGSSRINESLSGLLQTELLVSNIENFVAWYYTPMALQFTEHLNPSVFVFDCMDELSAFDGASPDILNYEKILLEKADIIFTGGRSLYESKKNKHPKVHLFPSSIDKEHFNVTGRNIIDPEDQINIPHPRIGYYGVIDERLDLNLLDKISDLRPDWNWIMMGPVVKIDSTSLPRKNNIIYLGMKHYTMLPAYLYGWDVAMMPFAINKSTEFISPTKVLEYMAGSKRIVSTPVKDVVHSYGDNNTVAIADTPAKFVNAIELFLENNDEKQWLENVNEILKNTSWDNTWQQMENIIDNCVMLKNATVVKTL
jgi:UDP-galactopyranose mutase